MGRVAYFSDGSDIKFGFACQPTSDITEFGGTEDKQDIVFWAWNAQYDLPIVNQKLNETIEALAEEGFDYEEGIKQNNNTKVLSLCAKIDLGLHIQHSLECSGYGYLEVEAEC